MTTDLKEQLRASLGHTYFFERELGAAGMSRVFLAHELALRRKVVVKVLPAELAAGVNVERFRREIQFAAQLQHPLIVTVLTAGIADGIPYYTMPFIEGESLGAHLARVGQMPVDDSVRVLCDVLGALSYAHARGIVHRDIKPDNILLTGQHAVVTDFGVAKALSDSSDPLASLTSVGIAIGTPAYMSPEQAAGDPHIDNRADLYATGALAYQMLTGEQIFSARSAREMFAAHAIETPEDIAKRRPSLPPALSSLVMRALAKHPADRPQTANEMIAELRAVTTPGGGGIAPTTTPPGVSSSPRAAPPSSTTRSDPSPKPRRRPMYLTAGIAALLVILTSSGWYWQTHKTPGPAEPPSLAVLPFENLGQASDAYFADGMTEEISSRLGRLSGLRVIGRQSARAYANSNKSASQIGKELGVTYILAGSVRWDRSRPGRSFVRVSPALLRVSDGTQVWSEPSEDELKGVFAIQSKVAEHVAQALRVKLSGGEQQRITERPTDNIDAYDYYLKGAAAMNGIRGSDYLMAVQQFEKATQRDPRFALAYAKLGYAHTEVYWFLADARPARLEMAKTAIDRALELNPDLPAAHNALGNYYYHGQLNYTAALREFSVADSLEPNNADAAALKSRVERRQGKWREGLADAGRAARLDPRNMIFLYDYAFGLIRARNYDAADSVGRQMIAVDPSNWLGYQERIYGALLRNADVATALAIMREARIKTDPRELGSNLSLFPWPVYRDKELLAAMLAAPHPSSLLEKLSYFQGEAAVGFYVGDTAAMHAAADSMIRLAPPQTEVNPMMVDVRQLIASGYALRGDHAKALDMARNGLAAVQTSGDAVRISDYLLVMAVVGALTGANDEAIAAIEKMLAQPSFMSRAWLRADPIFASLRSEPRFQKLVAEN